MQTGDGFYGNGNGVGSNSELSFTATSDGEVLVFARGLDLQRQLSPDGERGGGRRCRRRRGCPRLRLQAPVDSAIEVADAADVYRVAVEAGRTYLFELEGAAAAGGTLANAGLSLRYAGGVDIRHDEGGRQRQRSSRVHPGDGRRDPGRRDAGAGDEGNTGSYRLSVTMEPPALSDDRCRFSSTASPCRLLPSGKYSNGPEAGGEVFATWLGGSGQPSSAVGAFCAPAGIAIR
ncbi:MAG: hypothetical protein U0797_31805 [Gemmataceae bacterium]